MERAVIFFYGTAINGGFYLKNAPARFQQSRQIQSHISNH